MPESLTAEVLRNICKLLQLLTVTMSLAYLPIAAQLLMPVTSSALFSSTGKTQATQRKVSQIVFLYHFSSLVTAVIALTECID